MEDYCSGRNTSAYFKLILPEYHPDGVGKWGMDIYSNLVKYLVQKKASYNNNIDIRPFHGIPEHKKIMKARLKYLEKQGFPDPALRLVHEFAGIEDTAYNLMILSLKTNYQYRESVNNRMISQPSGKYLQPGKKFLR